MFYFKKNVTCQIFGMTRGIVSVTW